MIKLIEKIPGMQKRYPRHVKSLIEHSTPRKIRNLLRVELERRRRKTKVLGYPYILYIDPCNVCNLRCPLCPRGTNQLGRDNEMISFKTYKRIIDRLKDYTYEVDLYNWGEPFLNPEIFEMIEYNQKSNIGTNLSTNLSLSKPTLIKDILDSRLEYLSVSLDGVTAPVYNIYRIKGDFDLVVENLKELVAKRKERGTKDPFIEWQFIIMKHNEHQVEMAKKLAEEIQVDLIRFIPVRLILDYNLEEKKKRADEWFPKNPLYRKDNFEDYDRRVEYLHKQSCFHLYRSVAINPDGGVLPCNIIYHQKDDFGNILEQEFKELWNNDSYQASREIFSQNRNTIEKTTACTKCSIFRKPKPRTA